MVLSDTPLLSHTLLTFVSLHDLNVSYSLPQSDESHGPE